MDQNEIGAGKGHREVGGGVCGASADFEPGYPASQSKPQTSRHLYHSCFLPFIKHKYTNSAVDVLFIHNLCYEET